MKRKLQQTTKYFCTQEKDAQQLIEKYKKETSGDIIKQQIDMRNHKDYGAYYELTIQVEHTTSKSVLENGF